MTNEEKQDRIDDFLLGRGGADPGGTEETRRAMEAIEMATDRALKQRLRKVEAGIHHGPRAKVRPLRPRQNWLAIAAAVLLLLAAGWFLTRNSFQDLNGPELAMAHFEAYPNIAYPLTKGEDELDAAVARAFSTYEAGDYAAAAPLLAALPESHTHEFYEGQALLATGKYAAAAALFFEVSTGSSALVPEAEYYLALALIGQEKPGDAAGLLDAIAADAEHPFRAEATALLKKL